MLSGFALEIPLDLVGKRSYAPRLPEWVFFFFSMKNMERIT